MNHINTPEHLIKRLHAFCDAWPEAMDGPAGNVLRGQLSDDDLAACSEQLEDKRMELATVAIFMEQLKQVPKQVRKKAALRMMEAEGEDDEDDESATAD